LAIVVRFLMLLACVPLLAPPGLCACRAGERDHTQSHQEAAPAPERACCAHRHGPHDREASARPCEPTPRPAPAPHDNDHCPGCPAVTAGVERLPWSEPTAGAIGVPAPAALAGVPFVPAPPARHVLRPIAPDPSDPPLYLSHCSLVI